jgi:hypothetical protein
MPSFCPPNLLKSIDKQPKTLYNNNVGAPIRLLPQCVKKDNRTLWKVGRLSFFIIDINYKTDDCNNKRAKKEESFPSNVHWHHLPLYYEEGKKD